MASTLAGGRDGPLQFLEARLLFAAFLAMGVMTFSLVLYGEDLHATGEEPGLEALRNIGRLLLALFALPVLGLLAPPLAVGAYSDLRRGVVRMDGLVVLAVGAAFGLSLYATWTGTGEVYYETATMVLVLVTFGRRLEAHARTEGRDAADLLAAWLPDTVSRLTDEGEELVEPDALEPGDRLRLPPGERIPADVVVEEGTSSVSCAHVTGEPEALAAGPGDALPAGAENGHGVLTARVVHGLKDGTLGRLRDLLSAPLPFTAHMRVADRLAGVLTVVAILGAVVGAAFAPDVGSGLTTALSVLLVACPCALGLATPLAYRALRAALARRGLMVTDAAALERLPRVDCVLFDKTGTLTSPAGRAVTRFGDADAVSAMGALVRASGHALGAAFDGDARSFRVESTQVVPGNGVEGVVDGRTLRVGALSWVLTGAPVPASITELLDEPGASSGSLVACAEGGHVTALVVVEQRMRPEAPAVVNSLSAAGLAVEVLSGDRREGVQPLAKALGVPASWSATPDDKLARLTELQSAGKTVLVVGDGLNDAPVLRAADVSVAVGTGVAATRAVASVELVAGDLNGIAELFAAGRTLRRTVFGNLAWTLLYNGVALGLAVTGRLHPSVAALAMIASSLVVSVRCHRLLTWVPKEAVGKGSPERDAAPDDRANTPAANTPAASKHAAPKDETPGPLAGDELPGGRLTEVARPSTSEALP